MCKIDESINRLVSKSYKYNLSYIKVSEIPHGKYEYHLFEERS